MKNKKVLIILNDLSGGGAERIFVNIANDFVGAGVEVEFLLGRKIGVYFDILQKQIPVHELNAFNLYQYTKKLSRFLRNKEYTHIFTASDYITVATILAKKRLKFSAVIIATLHYNLPYQLSILPLPQKIWLKFLNRYFIPRADEIVAVSKGVADGFEKNLRRKKRKTVKVIYNPVFDDSIYQKAVEPLQDDFLDQDKITLINIGRLEIQKNHALLVDAFRLLSPNYDNLQLLILGQGSLENGLKKQVEEAGLNKKIHFLGFRQNPFSYLAKSDLFVLSSSYEGLPTVLIEALALGINVVSTDCPSGPDEILEYGKYGWLARNNDATFLAEAIEKGLANKKEASFLQKRALLFHKSNIIPQYLNLIS
jgi:glycosyltransferase involved in cell wall biosynthesis